jgi:hypothetical protein
VVGRPSHLTFGYGERTWLCNRCGERFLVCYPIPPKGGRKDMPSPRDGILRLTFLEGVRGYAGHVVLRAAVSAPSEGPPVSEAEAGPRESEEGAVG